MNWNDGRAINIDPLLTEPIRDLARHTLDVWSGVKGVLSPGRSIAQKLADSYREHLFGPARLEDLPPRPAPLFVINATNLQSGVLFRFTRAYAADWRVGEVTRPGIALADAVAASSAFPPFLSPFELDLHHAAWRTVHGNDPALSGPRFRDKVTLSDGGVYDNLGLETVWKRCRTVLVSDGGGHLPDAEHLPHDWARELVRVLGVIDNQVRSLRKRQTIASYELSLRHGAYWSIRSGVADYDLDDALDFPDAEARRLAAISTRLAKVNDHDQKQLINWGYVICDTALRRWVDSRLPRPSALPYP